VRYKVVHNTNYEYEGPVLQGHHLAHLKPRRTERQRVIAHEFVIDPQPMRIRQRTDYFGNEAHYFELWSPHERLSVSSITELEVVSVPLKPEPNVSWDDFAARLATDPALLSVREFCFDSPLVRSHPSLYGYAKATFVPGRNLQDAVTELMQRIFTEFKYETTATDVSTPLAQVMREKRGVCQDFAHVAVGCLRSLGLAARYVSGYLETSPPEGQERLVGADASHAWAATYLPEVGWFDFDPTNNLVPTEQHIQVAWGRDFSDVSPLKGVVLGGGAHTITVGVDVERQAAT
jgi:transglutaminase-like putative cysteine protease